MNNLVVQLLLKTGTFSTDLKQARGQIQNFQQGCQTAGKSLSAFGNALGINIGQLTKFGSVVGVAVLAGKELKAVIDSNQTSADAFQGAIAGCKGVVESFNQAIALADFSAFRDGLWSVYDAARNARDAIDALQDASWAYGYFSSKYQDEFDKARNIYNDPDSTKEQKEAAYKQMEEIVKSQWDAARSFGKKEMNAYVSQVVKEAGAANLNANDVTMAQFERAAAIKLHGDTADEERINSQYKEYQAKRKEFGKNNITAQEQLKKQYADVIAVHAMITGMNDDEIKSVAEIAGGMRTANRQAESMERTLIRTKKGMQTNTPKVTTPKSTGKNDIIIMENSLTYWKNIQREALTLRDAQEKSTEEWIRQDNILKEATDKIAELEKVESDIQVGSLKYWMNIKSAAETMKSNLVDGTKEWKAQDAIIKDAERNIELINERTSEIKPGSVTYWENMISSLRGKMEGSIPTSHSQNDLQALLKHAEFQLVQKKLEDKINYMGSDEGLVTSTIKDYEELLSLLKEYKTLIPLQVFDMDELKQIDELSSTAEQVITQFNGTSIKTDNWDKFNQAMANTSTIVSSMSNAFKDSSEVTAASILQMVATALPAIGSLMSSIQALTAAEAVEAGVAATGKAVATSKHWIEAIAAVASLGAVVASALSAASSAKSKFANGGIVGGHSYTGDRVTAQVNSGEMILNKNQQANLFRMANGGGGGRQVEFHISGTDLVGVFNNINRKNNVIR